MKLIIPRSKELLAPAAVSRVENIVAKVVWGVAIVLVLLLLAVIIWRPEIKIPEISFGKTGADGLELASGLTDLSALPVFSSDSYADSVAREANPHTDIPTRARETVEEYTVQDGDSLFAIAKSYNLKPDTILWANYDQLSDNADYLLPGMTLKIPPVDGILYKWKTGDTIEKIAAKYKASASDLLAWAGNNLDMTNPVIDADTMVMIPGGSREYVTWIVPTIARGRAGVITNIQGTCETSEGGLVGGGNFIWPTPLEHVLSGNDYWDGHLGIDIAAGLGTPIYASDSGVVVYAGPISGGYGNMVMIDHGNYWHTLYAHLSKISVTCGQNVVQGATIGYAGSTGNSTGPHLHFETRYMGAFVNPWTVLQ